MKKFLIGTVNIVEQIYWSNFESGGGIMRVKRARGSNAPEEGEGVGGELATKLGSSYQP